MKSSHPFINLKTLELFLGLCLILCLVNCGDSDEKRGNQKVEDTTALKDLSWCATNGDLNGVKKFLNRDNINGTEDQAPPLHLAAYGGHPGIVEYLITQGAKIDTSDGAGNYPIHTAASQGHIDVIKVLLRAGAKPDQESGAPFKDKQRMDISSQLPSFSASDEYQPIHSAAANNQPEAVKFFIELGVSPDAKDGRGMSVLDYAVDKRGWCNTWANTIRLVDRDGAFERASKEVISTGGYYVTDELNPKYIRFMPEELETYKGSNEVGPSNRVVICTGARGGTSPDEIAKWLNPHNEKAKKQGDFITGRYKLMSSTVSLETFDVSGKNITFSREGDQLKVSIRSMQQELFPESSGSGTEMTCKFVSWK